MDGTGIDALAIVSTGDLEAWVHHGDADGLGAACLAAWDAMNPNDITTTGPTVSRPNAEDHLLPHLRDALEQVWPENPFSRVGRP